MKLFKLALFASTIVYTALIFSAQCVNAETKSGSGSTCREQCKGNFATKAEEASCLMKCMKEKTGTGSSAPAPSTSLGE